LGPPDLHALADLASRRGLSPVLYKCDGRTAAFARAAGWRVARISQDAVINLTHWSLNHPTRRQLRRKLRDAAKGGLRIETNPKHLPLAEMAFVAQDWATRNNGEKGFSMGQFETGLLRHQQIVLGYVGSKLVGFASFHSGRQDWALDLMRHGPDAPSGTMHALVHAGLIAASQAGTAHVSLAAVPLLPGRWAGFSDRVPGVAGLRQFKRSFGPVWRPLYLCAPTLPSMARAALQITIAVHWPQRVSPPQPRTAARQDHHAYFEFETGAQACDAQGMIASRAADAIVVPRRPRTGRANVERPFPPS
jgi:phosphatidylglycerol lysyltransferase